MVTLLSWASALHVPSALLGLQGVDASGKVVSTALQKHGVSDAWIVASPEFTTAENHVFAVDGNLGQSTTVKATGSTSLINVQRMRKHFVPSLRTAGVCVAEIGSVPCAAVAMLLQEAKAKKRLSLLAVDVLPTAVLGESRLGTLEELQSCITNADVLMQPRDVAEQLLYMTADDAMSYEDTLSLPTTELASLLRSSTGVDLVAIVDGHVATKGCVLATLGATVHVPAVGACAEAAKDAAVEVESISGAGAKPEVPIVPLVHDTGVTHAFYGGLLSALYHAGGIPTEAAAITQAGYMANVTASACLRCDTQACSLSVARLFENGRLTFRTLAVYICLTNLTTFNLALFRNLFSLPDVENPDVLRELKGNPTVHAILDAVKEEEEEIQARYSLESVGARTTGEISGTCEVSCPLA